MRFADSCPHGGMHLHMLRPHAEVPGVDDAIVLQGRHATRMSCSEWDGRRGVPPCCMCTVEWYRGGFSSATRGLGTSAYMLSAVQDVLLAMMLSSSSPMCL